MPSLSSTLVCPRLSPMACAPQASPSLPVAPGAQRPCGEATRGLAKHVLLVNKAQDMLYAELGLFRYSALIADSRGPGTCAGHVCLGASWPNCSHLCSPRQPSGKHTAASDSRESPLSLIRGVSGDRWRLQRAKVSVSGSMVATLRSPAGPSWPADAMRGM